jgi:putative (di)nucleoside polyphosphate hydrolase
MNQNIKDQDLPYRKGAIGIVVNNDNKFLIVQMVSYGENDWRLPGGGVEEGEQAEDAILRELKEELGSDQFIIVKRSNIVVRYDWPENVIVEQYKKRKVKYRGQEQTQFLLKYTGDVSEIVIDPNELRQIKWIDIEEFASHFTFPNQLEYLNKTLKDLFD